MGDNTIYYIGGAIALAVVLYIFVFSDNGKNNNAKKNAENAITNANAANNAANLANAAAVNAANAANAANQAADAAEDAADDAIEEAIANGEDIDVVENMVSGRRGRRMRGRRMIGRGSSRRRRRCPPCAPCPQIGQNTLPPGRSF